MSIDPLELRKAFGCFATGVAVVTVLDENDKQKPFGITVNSFTSVSLDPALVLWCLGNDSEKLAQFTAATHYTINFLAQEQQSVSAHFSTPGQQGFANIPHSAGKFGCPVLEQSVGYIECGVKDRIPAGDHVIMLGEVLAVHYTQARPLLYACGAYAELK